MDITITPDGDGRYIIACPQEMDWNARISLVDTLTEQTDGEKLTGVIVDLEGVQYISSAGLGALFSLRKHLMSVEAGLVVSRPNVTIARLLETVNLRALVAITDTLDQARKALDFGRVDAN